MEIEPIAVVGLSCRLPGGANSPDQLWDILEEGRNTWTDVPRDRFRWESFYHPDADQPNATNHRGGHFLGQDVAAFDAKFFGIASHEAEAMDPQQRMLIELTYEALENAGLTRESVRGSATGVYTAVFNNDYQRILTRSASSLPKTLLTGNALAMLSNKISYLFDLRGPSIVMDTACSGSLVAIHQACQSLRTYEIETAIAGAANLILDPDVMVAMSDSHFLNGNGRSYSFDAQGDGYGRGEGVCMVVLKRLADAIRDGDTVRGVIRNTGLGQDGKTAGVTLPSAEAQARLIESVYARASLDPRETAYVEAHGTGTVAGDYAELETISKIFGNVHTGSIKANIGHTESTSGVAGLIKAILVLEKGIIPPNPPIEELKPGLLPKGSKVVIPQKAVRWPSSVRRASINSFGFGGTNAHCILESADRNEAVLRGSQTQFLLPLSANSQVSLTQTTQHVRQWLAAGRTSSDIRNLAYTLSSRRSRLAFRRSLIVPRDTLEPKSAAVRASPTINVTFVFTGQGAQWFAMGRELLKTEIFAKSIHRSEVILSSLGAPWILTDELSREKNTSRVNDSEIGQPACTAVQIALIDMLTQLNVRPSAVVGHSSGEIAAAYTAGVLSHGDALKVSYHRSFLAKRCLLVTRRKGAMAAVGRGEADLQRYLAGLRSGTAVIACANSPNSTTVSGDEPAIDELLETLQREDIFARRLQVDTAYHSHHMQAVAQSYLAAIDDIAPSPPTSVRFFSSVTGEEKTHNFDGSYWVSNLVSKVCFHQAITTAHAEATKCDSLARQIVVEIGPHHALAGPLRDTLREVLCLPTLLRDVDALSSILDSCGRLFEQGLEFALDRLHALDSPCRPRVVTDLAPYAWDHSTPYWLECRLSKAHRQRMYPQHELLGLRVPGTAPTEAVWRHFLSSANAPWLLEHVIDGFPIFPASGYITMAIEAMKQLSQEREVAVANFVLKDISFVRPLTIPDPPATVEVQISFQRARNGRGDFFVVSSVTLDGAWSEHATGWITVERTPIEQQEKLETTLQGKQLSHEDLYDYMASKGNLYGPNFATISEYCYNPVKAVGQVSLPDTARHMPSGFEQPYVIHPGPLDALLHTAIPVFSEKSDAGSVMAAELGKVIVAAKGLRGPRVDFVTTVTPIAPTSASLQVCAFDGEEPVVIISDGRLKGMATDDIVHDSPEYDQTYTICWHEDLDLVPPGELRLEGLKQTGPELDLGQHLTVQTPTLSDVSSCLLELLKSIAFKKPKLRIIEIGAGASGLAKPLLDGVCKEWYTSIDLYHYTDPSSQRLESAREMLKEYPMIEFQNLDITQNPVQQRISESDYDLAIAAMWFRTSSLDDAVAGARKLLRPGGRLILIDTQTLSVDCTNRRLLSVTEWNDRLIQNGFDGVEFSMDNASAKVMVAQAVDLAQTKDTTPVRIIASPRLSPRHRDFIRCLREQLGVDGRLVSVDILPLQPMPDAIHVIADDHAAPILASATEREWSSISGILSQPNMRLLWLTSEHEPSPPTHCEYGLALGLCRSARIENPSLKVVNVNAAGADLCEQLAHILHKCFLVRHIPQVSEYEIRVRNGHPSIPRLRSNETFNRVMKRAAGFDEPEWRPFHQEDQPLRLSVRGLLDSMVFVPDERALAALPACEVEVRVEAFGVNFKDVMLAVGQLDESIPMAGEFAGVVTAVGADFQNRFSIGDRVCGLNATPYASQARTHGDNVHHLPSSMSFSEGASIPVAFATAYHCLVNLARLEPQQTILIHVAAGSVGQAAISIAKYIGAEIFVTAGTESKIEFLMERFGISRDHIFSSRSSLFKAGIMRMTQTRGVDVVLNSLSKDLLCESLDCVARFGSFLEIGKYDITKKHDISLAPFDKAIQFFAVDLTSIAQYRPQLMNSLLAKTLQGLQSGAYLHLPITVWPLSQIESGFRQVKEGKLIGKTVLEASGNDVLAKSKRKIVNYSGSGTFVIAGGLGGLGLEVARHLASCGAKHIALLSRRALAISEREDLHNDFRSLGAEIYLVKCNVADRVSLPDLAPPVETIIQSAVVTDDQSIEQMSFEQFRSTQPSKLDGSRNLLKAFAGPHLKQMIMLSSCAGTFGGMRASNYAAANAAQDALAIDHADGTVRLTTLDLGPIEDVGILAQQSNLARTIAAQGCVAWGMEDVFTILDSLLDPSSSEQPPKQLLVGFTKESMNGAHRLHNVNNPVLKHVLQSTPTVHKQTATSTLEMRASVENASNLPAAASAVREHLGRKICSLSAIDFEDVADEIPLSEFGLDSLVLMELKNWILRTFMASLQTTTISDAPSLTILSNTIASRSKLLKHSILDDSSSESLSDSVDERSSMTDMSPAEVAIPKQPFLELRESIEQYLEEVKLICSPAEFEKTRDMALDLISSAQPALALLQKAADDPTVENWFSDLYAKGNFLRERNTLIGRSSFLASQPLSRGYDPVNVAVALTMATLDYKTSIETGHSATRYLMGRQIDMSAEQSIFNAIREPFTGEDRMVKHTNHDYVVVLRRGHAFQVPSTANFRDTFRAIQDLPLGTRCNLTALTGDGRDDWAKYREYLRSLSDTNAASLEVIEAAAFVLCFDETTPDGPGSRASQFFCGDHHTNRWYDKTLQFIVCPDGSAASLVGHTLLDGTSVEPLREFILPKLQDWLESPVSTSGEVLYTPLHFDADEHISERIDSVQTAMAELQDASSFESFALPDLGNDFWRAHRLSPKSSLQVLIQLAVHLYYGCNVHAMETVSLARYRRGRSALTSLVSPQIKAFCDAVVHRAGRRALFVDAVNAHNAALVHASAGKLPRANLTALKWAAEEMGTATPAFFADPAWERYSREQVTVDCLESDFEECGLLQHEDRVWVHFQPQQSRTLFSVCAGPTHAAVDFRACIESAAHKVTNILSCTV